MKVPWFAKYEDGFIVHFEFDDIGMNDDIQDGLDFFMDNHQPDECHGEMTHCCPSSWE